jgi:hypothetical protein
MISKGLGDSEKLGDNDNEECCCCFNFIDDTMRSKPSCGHTNICLRCYNKMISCPLCRDLWFITVRVKMLNGACYTLQWGVNDSTESFSKTFCKLANLQSSTILVHRGRILTSESTPQSWNIENNSILLAVENLRAD